MFFRNFRRSGPSRIPILRILGIYVIQVHFRDEKGVLILRPGEHFAPDFGVWIFNVVSRHHCSSLFCVFGALRCPEAVFWGAFWMTFPCPPENVKSVFSLESQLDSAASGGFQNHRFFMFFHHFRGSWPSRVPILRIFGICVISGTLPRRKVPILRLREHFAPDFGALIFDVFSRRHSSSLFCVFGALRCPEVVFRGAFPMTFCDSMKT